MIAPQAVPLVIAVVGHRDPRPEALPRLRELFRQDLERLLRALPHTPLLRGRRGDGLRRPAAEPHESGSALGADTPASGSPAATLFWWVV